MTKLKFIILFLILCFTLYPHIQNSVVVYASPDETDTWPVEASSDDCHIQLNLQRCVGFNGTGDYGIRGSLLNRIAGTNATAGWSGKIERICAYLDNDYSSGTQKVKCAVYFSNQTLLCVTEEKVIPYGTEDWITFNVVGTKPYVDKNAKYHVVAWSDSSVYLYYVAESGAGVTKSVTYNSFPNPLGGSTYNYKYSIYAILSAIELTTDRIEAGWYFTNYEKTGSGMRFNGINIPQGTPIISAYLNRCVQDVRLGEVCRTKISGEDADNATTFIEDIEDFESRPRTNSVVEWDNIPTDGGGDYDTWKLSINISIVIQEIINLEEWQSGNSIVIFWEDFDDRSDHNASTSRTGHSYDSNPSKAPKLQITWTSEEEFTAEITINTPSHSWILNAGDSNVLINEGIINITVTANKNYSIQVKGSGNLTCGDWFILLSNVKVHKDNISEAISLTISYQDVPELVNLPSGTGVEHTFMLWLSVPNGTRDGNYTYTLTVKVAEYTG